jgi:probable HAF family extracellular repeat protein
VDGAWVDLGPGRAIALNDAGDVLLQQVDGSPPTFPVLWRGGERTELRVPGVEWFVARALSERGAVAGVDGSPGCPAGPVVYRDGRREPLPPPIPGIEAVAERLNDRGDVVGGTISTAEAEGRAFLWRDGCSIDVSPPGAAISYPVAITEDGLVVGVHGFDDAGGFVWRDGRVSILPPLPGAGFGFPSLVNRSNVIAGTVSREHGYDSRVVVWTPIPCRRGCDP